jgi:hypothetical protein
MAVFASTGFHSQEARGTLFLQNIENQCCHCDCYCSLVYFPVKKHQVSLYDEANGIWKQIDQQLILRNRLPLK